MKRMNEVDRQRTFGFGGEPEVVDARYPDPNIPQFPENIEELEDIFPDYVKSVSGFFTLYESSKYFEMDGVYGYKNLPKEKEVMEAIGYEYASPESFLEEEIPELLDTWNRESESDPGRRRLEKV